MWRAAAAAAVLVAMAAGAHADDAYPEQLVDRAPYLPTSVAQASVSIEQIEIGVPSVGVYEIDLDARYALARAEPFVDARLSLDEPRTLPDSPGWSHRLLALSAGARVRVTDRSDVKATLISREPTVRGYVGYTGDLAYEGRAPVLRWLALSGEVGVTVGWVHIDYPPMDPADTMVTYSGTYEIAHGTGVAEAQIAPFFAFAGGATAEVEHDSDSGTTRDLAPFARAVYTSARVDVIGELAFPSRFAYAQVLTLTIAARF